MRRERPSPLDEVRSALAVFEETLWDALPLYCRSLDRTPASEHRPRTAARGRADPVRLVDRRRSRRQPVRHAGSHAQRLPDGALDGPVALREGDRAAALRAVDVGRHAGTAVARRRGPRAVPRAAAVAPATRRGVSTADRGAPASAPPGDRRAGRARRPAGLHLGAGNLRAGVGVHGAAPALPPLAARHRQRHHRRRPADRRPPPDGGIWPDARAARRPSGSRAAHRGRRCDHARARAGRIPALDRRTARRLPGQRAVAGPQADAGASADDRARRGSARHVPDDGGGASRVARRLRHHDGREAVRRAGGRAPAARGRRDAAAPGRAALRDRARPARRRGHDRCAAVDPVVPRSRHAERGPAGSDGRLFRLGEGRRAARRGVGALQGAGIDRRNQPRARRAGDALPRPRRQRRPRRRSDTPGDPLAAARARSTARSASPSRAR